MHEQDDVVVARQGIWDADGIVGYELLFRPAAHLRGAGRPSGDQMTAEVVYGALSMGLSAVAGDRLVFCNADRGVLVGEVPLMLPPERTVVEVLESVQVDEDVVAGCQKLLDAGFRLALDDVTPDASHTSLLPLVTDVKIDLLGTPRDQVPELAAWCRSYGVRLLAEKVEDADDLPWLRSLGFELFQGFALDRPAIVAGRTLTPGSASRIGAAVDILGGDAGFDELEALLVRDPGLAHQVLRLASTGRPGETRRELRSIRDGLVLAGTTQVRNWLALLLARPGGGAGFPDAFLTTITRARVCELIAPQLGADARLAFTAGMLSALDGLFAVSPDEIADKLALSTELRDAAFDGVGPLGRLVRDVAAYPHRGAQRPRSLRSEPGTSSGIAEDVLDAAFAEAFGWAVEAVGALS